jgi:hypothetical protein
MASQPVDLRPYKWGGPRWGNEHRISPTWVGAAGELTAAANLIQRGYLVYQSAARTGPFDLIAYRNGEFLRIEVRSIRVEQQKCDVRWEEVDLLARVMPDGLVLWSPREP